VAPPQLCGQAQRPRRGYRSRASRPAPANPRRGLRPRQWCPWRCGWRRWRTGRPGRWTQDQACDALEPHLGKRWSKANYSAAERSVDGSRIRQFDADEIVAFARAFDMPIGWFFLPPPPWASSGVPAKLQIPDAERFGAPLALLADLVFGQDHQRGLMDMRFQVFLDELGPNKLSDAQQRIADMVQARKEQIVRHTLGDLQQWQTQLRALANHLEELEYRSKLRDNG
jgi:hypothetical protein